MTTSRHLLLTVFRVSGGGAVLLSVGVCIYVLSVSSLWVRSCVAVFVVVGGR